MSQALLIIVAVIIVFFYVYPQYFTMIKSKITGAPTAPGCSPCAKAAAAAAAVPAKQGFTSQRVPRVGSSGGSSTMGSIVPSTGTTGPRPNKLEFFDDITGYITSKRDPLGALLSH